jgi:hypothetical protein
MNQLTNAEIFLTPLALIIVGLHHSNYMGIPIA